MSGSSLRCLLFSDLVGSTALKTRLGDAAAGDLIARHQAHVRGLIGESAGREVDSAGDGFFVTFRAPSAAVSLGLRLQQIHAAESDLPAVRVGIHLGEVTERPAPAGSSKPTLVEGLAVDVASRVASLALPRQVLMSSAVFEAARPRLGADELGREISWLSHGAYHFEGVGEPLEIVEVGFEGISALASPPGSDKARRVARPGNLPTLLPAFVGRDAELASLLEVIRSHRLVTLVGTAGTGKTRTAIEGAGRAARDFAGGVWLVDLAPESGPGELAAAVARALAIAPEVGVSVLDSVVDALRYRPALLVLDNCEHVTASAAELAERLLESCAELRVVATSREPLHSRVEHVFLLGPMSTGSEHGGTSEAVALFLERARSEGVTARQLDEDRGAIEQLCARLDGLPLAIELAAGRARTIGARQLAERLDERFRVLKASRRPADSRHETLRSAIDWSYEHLDAAEQALFDGLSLFGGPFEVADVVALGSADELELLDRLSGLVDRSMVVAMPGRLPTYRLLETLRAYGSERLASRADLDALRRRHAEHFAVKAAAARAEVVGPRHVAVVDLLVAQAPEYRAATAWARRAGDLELAVRVAAGFCGASYFRIGYDALDWLGPSPESAARTEGALRSELLGLLARRALFGGDSILARELAERAIAADPGPASVQARAQIALILGARNDPAMLEWAESAIDVAAPVGDHLGVMLGRLILGPCLARLGRRAEALEVGRSLLALGDERHSDHARGWGHYVLGVALAGENPERSREHLRTAVHLGRVEGNRYLESNARIAELEAQLDNNPPSEAASAARHTLESLHAAADRGFFTRHVLSQVTAFVGARGRAEACQLDGYLDTFSDSGRQTRWGQVRAAALRKLADRLGQEEIEHLRRLGGRLDADEAVRVATTALDELVVSPDPR